MSVKEIALDLPPPPGIPPLASNKGYAMALKAEDSKTSMILVFSEAYATKVLPVQNALRAKAANSSYGISMDAPAIKHVQWLDGLNKSNGFVDYNPKFNEIIDVLFDLKANETDIEKAVLRYDKRYNLIGGNFVLYRISQIMPLPFPPLPASPIF